MNLLDLLIFAPALGVLVIFFLPKDGADTIKRATFLISILIFLGSLLLIPGVLGVQPDDVRVRYAVDLLPQHPLPRRH